MSQSIFHVRPLDAGKGWAIDEYDGRGAWQSTIPKGPDGAPMDKQRAQRAVFQLRRKAINSAFKSERVNKTICNCRNPKKANIICARPAGHSGPHEAYRDSWWEET